MANPIISIIMPVHNTADYLPEALDSLLAQTFTQYELICVNDASTDESEAVLHRYQRERSWAYPMQIVVNKTAQGAARARNSGMSFAKGEYWIFLDSDDRFAPRMLEKAYCACREHQAEVAVFGVNHWYPGGEKWSLDHRAQQKLYLPEYPVLNQPKDYPLLPYIMEGTPWNKLVHRDVIQRGHIRFQDIPNSNDVFYSYSVLLEADRAVFLDEILIDYRCQRPGNLSEGRTTRKSYMSYALDACYGLAAKLQLHPQVRRVLLNSIIRRIYGNYDATPAGEIPGFLQELREIFLPKWGVEAVTPDYFVTRNLYDFCQEVLAGRQPQPYFYTLLQCSGAVAKQYFAQWSSQGKRVALWGAGKFGQASLRFFAEQGIRLDAVIDTNKNKQGTTCDGYIVQGYEAVEDSIDLILITNSKWRSSIEKQTGAKKEIVDLMELLENLQVFA